MTKSCKVAFIIPALNAEKTIQKCLTSIQSQILQNEFLTISTQILVVDNNSTDATSEIARSLNVPVINEGIRNRSRARNLGYKNVDADWIAFIDADTVLENSWLLGMLEHALSSEMVGGIDSCIISSSLNKPGFIEELRAILKIGQNNLLRIKGQDYPMINSAACLYRKDALIEIDGFDPELNSYEDTDLSRRLFLAGWILICNEKDKAFCYNADATFFGFLKRYFELGKYRYLYTLKWTPKTKWQTCLHETESFLIETRIISSKIFKNSNSPTAAVLTAFMSAFLFSKMLGNLWMFIQGKSIQKMDLKNFNSLIRYKGRHWGLVTYPHSYLLFDPIKKDFLEFKKAFDLNMFIKYCQKDSHEN